MAGTVGNYKYTSDDGVDYSIRQSDDVAAAIGNVAATSEPSLARGYHPRHIYMEYSTYRRRAVVSDPADVQWVGSGATVSMKIFPTDASPVTWNIRGRIGERRFSI